MIEPQIALNLKYVPVGLAVYFGEGCMPKSRRARSLPHSSLAPPLRILQGRPMAPI